MKDYTMSKYLSEEDLYADMRKDLISILDTMDIPKIRMNPLDLNWLRRNIFFRSNNHPKFIEANNMIRRLQIYEYRKVSD